MSGWGTGWEKFNTEPTEYSKEVIKKWGCVEPTTEVEIPNKVLIILDGDVVSIPKFLNKHPTHDPYTNPNSHIYYECGCGAILDPGTKSFAALNNNASEVGWKVRWGADSYVPYCVKCGEDVE